MFQVDTKLPLNSFDTEGRLDIDTPSGADKVILGSDLSIFGTVSTYFTEQEDPTQDLSPKPRTNPNSPLLIEEEEENFYNADVSELSDTDQSESKSTKSSCDRPRLLCDKCVVAGTAANPSPKPGSNCGCASLTSHRPALRTKNLSNSNNETTQLKSGSSFFHASHDSLSPRSPKSPKSSGLGGLSDNSSRLPLVLGQQNSSLNLNILPASASLNDRSQDPVHSMENIMSPPPPLLQVSQFL